ncbi:hypothetical protein AOL_s00210g192 [Orbilia oligospora ATCC 24927]|uniref:Uncharacterized protein n=1 Tax=Arthrobotrys oligospora (strain ATCC 24927 / CBS 115.81 / DSM 1491) TaxID=756982 RepID=G1XS34_ARTOA|nr:hypothetical protein AOL_s00210g192 [Orbilia oligospora ATCC 24927]EGX44031.1 hypothetical protein AOL_s00210g192 [Orbilia oligospora ATCC 24927]
MEVLSVSSRPLRSLMRRSPELRLVVAGRSLDAIRLTGDPEAFRIIFSILHFNPASDIRDINLKTFAQITFLSQKYAWKKALEVWNPIWLDKLEPHALEPGNEDWLYVADIFGRNSSAEALVTCLGKEYYPVEGTTILDRRLLSYDGVRLDTSLWPQEQLRKIEKQRRLRLNHLLWSICELRSILNYLCTETRHDPNFHPGDQVCGSTACHCLAYGSLLRKIHQAGWEIGIYSIPLMLDMWNRSARKLQEKLGSVGFDTLEIVDPEHRCSLLDIKSGFLGCIMESDIGQQESARRTFGRSIARHMGPGWSYTRSLPQILRHCEFSIRCLETANPRLCVIDF